MAETKNPPKTPSKGKKRPSSAAVVTPQPKKSKDVPPGEAKWKNAMSIFRKFEPGLGHDGTGLYGTLTNATLRRMLERCDVVGKTHVDVGAADGKVLLGATALGAKHAYGLEISGPALATKFEAMRDMQATKFPSDGEKQLATGTDITELDGSTVEAWLAETFGAGGDDDDSEITVSAVWHGFNTDAKECLLAACATSARVCRFSLIGPAKREYGGPEAVIDYVKSRGARAELVGDDLAHLSGSGENQRVMTFAIRR